MVAWVVWVASSVLSCVGLLSLQNHRAGGLWEQNVNVWETMWIWRVDPLKTFESGAEESDCNSWDRTSPREKSRPGGSMLSILSIISVFSIITIYYQYYRSIYYQYYEILQYIKLKFWSHLHPYLKYWCVPQIDMSSLDSKLQGEYEARLKAEVMTLDQKTASEISHPDACSTADIESCL